MNDTKCVIKRNSPALIAVAVLGLVMIAGTVVIYRYDTVNNIWWTAIMTPDKYNTVAGAVISFGFRILCGLSMFSVFLACRSLNFAAIPAVTFIATSALASVISRDPGHILSHVNAVCLAFIAYIFLFQRIRLLRKNKWVSVAFVLPIVYYIVGTLTGRMTDSHGFIYISSHLYFSLMFLAFTAIGLSAAPVTDGDSYDGGELL